MTSPIPTSAPQQSISSPSSSKTRICLSRSTGWDAPWLVGAPRTANWHTARVSNAATEAANNLIKRVKRVAFGFTNFANYRICSLLYAGKPNWALLDTLTPP